MPIHLTDGIQPILNEVQVLIVEQEKCRDAYASYPEYPVTDNMICLGHINGGKGVCTVSIDSHCFDNMDK